MGTTREIHVPDLGTDDKVDVIEVLVAPGETVAVEDGLVTLESDKATMDVPSPAAGEVVSIAVKVGDKIGEGDLILTLVTDAGDPEDGGPDAGAPEEGGLEDGESEDGEATPGAEAADTAAIAESSSAESPSATDSPAGDEPRSAARGAGARKDASRKGASKPRAQPARGGRDTDVLVLGAGPGGYTAAFRAADLGRRVTLVERYPTLGGVCLNVGCIPSKALLHVARVIDEAADLGERGVEFGEPKLDLEKLRDWKNGVVAKLTGGLAKMAEQRGVEVVAGTGRFTGPHELEVETEDGARAIGFSAAIVAVGSRVAEIPGIPYDDPRIMDSTGALDLADVPERLLVVGGGIIGLEMANVYGALGSEITIVELLDGLVPGCDRDLVKPLERRLTKRYGAAVHTGTRVARVEAAKKALTAHLEGPKGESKIEVDRVLVSVGRRPNGDRIGAEAAGLEVDEGGFLRVDRHQRTNVAHIYAIGDVTGQPMLAHKASHEGKVAAEVAAGEKSAMDARVIPSVAYTDPEIAWVGLTETEAAERGAAYETGVFPWAASGRALGMGRSEGRTKLLFDPETKRLMGAGVVGPGAGDLIAELALAIEMQCEAADLALTVHPHPTLSETIAFAAEVYEGTITDLYLPKRR